MRHRYQVVLAEAEHENTSDRVSYTVSAAIGAYNRRVKSVNSLGGTSIRLMYTRGCAPVPSKDGHDRANIATTGMHGHGKGTIPHRKVPI